MDLLFKRKIAVLGCGNLGESLVAGLIEQGLPPGNLWLTSRRAERQQQLKGRYGSKTGADNLQAAEGADAVILAVKPQQMAQLCSELVELDWHGKLLISVAAGLPIDRYEAWLEQSVAFVRSMPNTPAELKLAATGLYANALVSAEQREWSEQIFSAIGRWVWIEDEAQMDLITAIAGSGPAYFYRFIEAMIASAVAQGMSEETATILVTQTALGAGALAARSGAPAVDELRQRVTSKGGTTEAALKSLEAAGISDIVDQMIRAAVQRGRELANS